MSWSLTRVAFLVAWPHAAGLVMPSAMVMFTVLS
jgi:hypothetical protein